MAYRTLLRTRRGPAVTVPPPPPDGPRRPVAAAIAFIAAQPFGPDRILAIHAPLSDGSCRACQAHPTRWPCTVAALAMAYLWLGRRPAEDEREATADPSPSPDELTATADLPPDIPSESSESLGGDRR